MEIISFSKMSVTEPCSVLFWGIKTLSVSYVNGASTVLRNSIHFNATP